MDLRDTKNQKFALALLIVVLAIYIWHSQFYTPKSKMIESKQVEYESILTNLKNVELKAKSFENLKAEYENLLEKYKRVELLLPEEKQVPLLLTELHQAAQTTEAKITEIVPRGVTPIDFYNGDGYSIQVTGTYHKLGNLFASIANFPFIANVTKVSLIGQTNPQSQSQSQSQGNTITAHFELTNYFIREQDRLKRINF